LEKITYKASGKELEAYEADEIDYAELGVADQVVAENDPVLKNELDFSPTCGMSWLQPLPTTDKFLYDHPEVVKAIWMAFDMAPLAESIWLGQNRSNRQLHYEPQPGHDPALDMPYDPEKARQILADAGFPDGKGVPKLKISYPHYHGENYASTHLAIAEQVKNNIGIELVPNNIEAGILSGVAEDMLPSTEYTGFKYGGMGEAWTTPMYGFRFKDMVRQFDDYATYEPWGKLVNERSEIEQGLMTIEGGSDADFDKLLEDLDALRSEALAVFADDKYGQYLREQMAKRFDGWSEGIAAAKEAAKDDREAAWADANARLWNAKAATYLTVNRRKELRQLDEWEIEALETPDPEEQLELARKAQEMIQNEVPVIPLWVWQRVALIKPYVYGFQGNPFSWGVPLYMKRVSIEAEPIP
jgi:ABC-type transport system substrate-binding protein